MRTPRSLAGLWQFQLDPAGTLTSEALQPDREITVPLPWQAAFPDLQTYSGYAWYRTALDIPADWLGGALLLHFGAVDYWCEVYVNKQFVGQHEGGYTPFTLHIQDYVQAGTNELTVRVYDSAQTHMLIPRWPDYQPEQGPSVPPFDANNVPHGKQEWYINVGGIWQDVTLTAVAACYIDHIQVVPDIHAGVAHLTITLAGAPPAAGTLAIVVTGGDTTCGTAQVALDPDHAVYTLSIALDQPRLWSTDDPYLYTATVQLGEGDTADTLTTRFGLREITARDGALFLNGAPLYLLGALDQDLYPDTIYTVPSDAFLRDQFRKAQELGLNCLRCHIKPPDPRYLDLADEMGLLVWAEIPSWRTFYPKGTQFPALLDVEATIRTRVENTLRAMIRRDFNHPSVIIWTLVNEDWGTALPLSAPDRAWVADLYDQCKALDPTRLVVDNSACPHAWGPNIHVRSDLDDFHLYANIPEHARSFEQSVEQLNMRPLWTYSSHGDAQRTGQEPVLLSEFGNWGLPSLATLRAHYGGDPGWFGIGPWWSPWDGEPGWAAGVEERFLALGLEAVWPDYEAFVTATQWHQYAALQYQLGVLRRQHHLAGYVITEFTDAYWESNGLLDFVRQPKAYHDRFAHINAPDVVVPHLTAYNGWDDGTVTVRLDGARYSGRDWDGATLRATVGGVGVEHPITPPAVGAVGRLLRRQELQLPPVETPTLVPLEYALTAPAGQVLAQARVEVLTLPAAMRVPGYAGRVAVICRDDLAGPDDLEVPPTQPEILPQSGAPQPITMLPDPIDEPPRSDLEHSLRRLGYRTAGRLTTDTGLAVTNYPNAALLQWVRNGGDLLFLASGPSPFFWVAGRGGAYSGNWMTSFSWMRPGVYKRVPTLNPLSLPYMRAMPHHTILGLPVHDPTVQGDFLAGMLSGWVGHPTVHTVQFRYGRGRVIMTTFALEGGLDRDAVCTALFHDLVDYLHSPDCRPTLQSNY